MIKRFYKRFLLWVLRPALDSIAEQQASTDISIHSLQSQINAHAAGIEDIKAFAARQV